MTALDEMLPSVELLRVLSGLDRASLDFDQRLSAVAAWERIVGFATACQNELLADAVAEFAQCTAGTGPHGARWFGDQVGVALGISGTSAQHRMNTAVTLVEKLPQVTAALRVGAITTHHARVAAVNVHVLDTAVARAVDAAVMTDPDWRTPSQLERTFERIVRAVDPDGARRRHEQAREERRGSLRAEPDGMCSLWALLPAEDGQLVHKTLDAAARSSKAQNCPGDDRTLDERRADALVESVTQGPAGDSSSPKTHGRTPQIHVTVALSTLIGVDDAPADLTGYGWIDAATARRIAADPGSVWRRLLVDPASGRLLDYGRSTYTPPQDLQDFVITRDRYCRFPTCDRPAAACDLDHRTAWNADDTTVGGTTGPDNLDTLCRNHHRLKHEAGWVHHREPDTGTSIWTDPGGTVHAKPATALPCPAPVEPPSAAPGNDGDEPPF